MASSLLIAASALSFEEFPVVDMERQVHGLIALVPLVLTTGAVLSRVWLYMGHSISSDMEQMLVILVAVMVILTTVRLGLMLRSSKSLFTRADASRLEAEATAAALRESEERFRATFDQAAVGIAHNDIDGRCLLINQRMLDFFGYSWEEMSRLRFQDVTHPDDLTADLDQYERLIAGEIKSYSLEKRYVRKDGSAL